MDRRSFVSALATSGALLNIPIPNSKRWDVAVIGHTGRGDFGHGIDEIWKYLDNTQIVGVSDSNPKGLPKSLKRLGLPDSMGYTDYQKMLTELRPGIVAVCPRHVDQHKDMILSAINSGVRGIYVEKPFLRTPAECDEVLAASQKSQVKIAIAHRNRYHPTLPTIRRLINEGAVGQILEIRGRGKGDHRGGLEDLWVLGSHVLNLITYLSGPPISCSAQLLKSGRPVAEKDVLLGAEGLGLMAGNELHARFLFESGIIGYFDSIANDGTANKGFGLQILGSKGVIDLCCDKTPLAYYKEGNPFDTIVNSKWVPISSAGISLPEPIENLHKKVYEHFLPAKDLVRAMEKDQPPVCDFREGALTVEMITAVMLSHVQQKEVTFPLDFRGAPLENWD